MNDQASLVVPTRLSPFAVATPSGARGEPAHEWSVPAESSRLLHAASDDSSRQAPAAQIRARGVTKTYHKGRVAIPVLQGADLDVSHGEFLALVGQSGSGKSTLLHLLGTLDVPDQGEIWLGQERVDHLPASRRDRIRNRQVGMIFQFYHLLPELNTLENVLAPVMIAQGVWRYLAHRAEHQRAARELLEMVGLSHRLKHRPRELSGGEMQRAAIARALVQKPEVLLADEPTGNLDPATGAEIIRILRTLNREQGLTIVMVSHDSSLAAGADRVVRLAAGRVEAA